MLGRHGPNVDLQLQAMDEIPFVCRALYWRFDWAVHLQLSIVRKAKCAVCKIRKVMLLFKEAKGYNG